MSVHEHGCCGIIYVLIAFKQDLEFEDTVLKGNSGNFYFMHLSNTCSSA